MGGDKEAGRYTKNQNDVKYNLGKTPYIFCKDGRGVWVTCVNGASI